MQSYRQPFPNSEERARLAAVRDDVDEAAQRVHPRPVVPPMPQAVAPTYGGPQRDAINSVVDDIVRNVIDDIVTLRRQLDALEQQVLHGAAGAKHVLNEQVGICLSVKQQVGAISDVIDDIAKRALQHD